MLGLKVADIVNQQQLKGEYKTIFNLSSIPAGIYTCKFIIDGENVEAKKIIVNK